MTRKKSNKKSSKTREAVSQETLESQPPVNDGAAEPELAVELVRGTVIKGAGGLYEVDVRFAADGVSPLPEGLTPGDSVMCNLRGLLKKGRQEISQPVAVGDSVLVRPLKTTGADARGRHLHEGYLIEVLPRRSVLARSRFNKTAQVTMANLDQVVIVMSLREPELNRHRLDRFLVLAEASDLDAVICFNKIDLINKRIRKKEIDPIRKLYEGLGYKTATISAETDEGILELRELLKDKISAVLGSSGVGKSSTVNAVQPGLHLWVGDVMDIGKGRHITTDVSLHPLSIGGYLADTPGIKTVSLLDRDELDLAQCFPEFLPLMPQCRFNNCRHINEPGCAVIAAVQSEDIAASRYESYLKMSKDGTSTD